MGLQTSTKEEEPLVWETFDAIQIVLLKSQARGLSLPGALKAVCASIAQILASAYAEQKERDIVLSGVPDVVGAMIPIFEKLIAKRRVALSEADRTRASEPESK